VKNISAGFHILSTGGDILRRKTLNMPKENECSHYKSTAAIFSSSLPNYPVYFHLVMPENIRKMFLRFAIIFMVMSIVTRKKV
jgi:hypothetical protein